MPRKSRSKNALQHAAHDDRTRAPTTANRVAVSVSGGPHPGADPRVLARRASKMLAAMELEARELSVALVDDTTIQSLNRDYRNIDRPTDVLAFPMDDDEWLGDVIIAVPTARRQAQRRRKPLLDELTFLLAHGLLHLLGYDHENDSDERIMNDRTKQLVTAAKRRAHASGLRSSAPPGR